METYYYDGSFEGLLGVFADVLIARQNQCAFERNGTGHADLFTAAKPVSTDDRLVSRLWKRLFEYGGEETARHLIYVYLSEIRGFEQYLYDFVRLTLKHKRPLFGWYGHESISKTQKMARKVMRETCRFTGLLRFMELDDGSLYAPYEPDHNITSLLAPHFCRRMPHERWAIHDRKRNLAVLWDGKNLHPVEQIPKDMAVYIAEKESTYQQLWQSFTCAVAVPERTNPALQRQFMPSRYWRYLPEKQAQ